eukprot:245166_1
MVEFRGKLEGVECIVACCLGYLVPVDIAAIGIGLQFDAYSECDGQGSVMNMNGFAIMAGGIGITAVVLSTASVFWMCSSRNDPRNAKKQGGLLMLIALLFLVISIIGFVSYGSCTEDCQQSPLGQLVLAWCMRVVDVVKVQFLFLKKQMNFNQFCKW